MWLESGLLKEVGEAKEVCEHYLSMQIEEQNREKQKLVENMVLDNTTEEINAGGKKSFAKVNLDNSAGVSGTGAGEILSFYVRNEKDEDVTVLEIEKTYNFGLLVKFREDLDNALFGFEMENVRGVKLFSVNNFLTNEA